MPIDRIVLKYVEGRGMVPYGEYLASLPQPHGQSAWVYDDTMPATLNHADNRMYDSKSAFRRATKAAGYVEVGNDLLTQQKHERPGLAERIGDDKISLKIKEAMERHGQY